MILWRISKSCFLGLARKVTLPREAHSRCGILQYAYHRAMNRRQHLNVRNFYKNADVADLETELLTSDLAQLNDQEIRYLVQALKSLSERRRRGQELAWLRFGRSVMEQGEASAWVKQCRGIL
jgi:hypothetical protein